jgi:ABC-type amino acid transport system permease subunit
MTGFEIFVVSMLFALIVGLLASCIIKRWNRHRLHRRREMRKFLVLSILVCILVSCSTPTTEKPAEAKPVVKADIRYYFEFLTI